MGDAATPTIPNFTNQTASVYKANIDAGFAVADRLAWAFAPHQQDQGSPAPDMTLRLEAGAIFDGATLTEVAAQSTGILAAPTTNPRIDRIVVDATSGAVSVVTGTEAASPTPPAMPAGKFPVAQVLLDNSPATTEIADSLITDERVGFLKVTGLQTIHIPAAAMSSRDTSGAENGSVEIGTTYRVQADTKDFDSAADEFVQFAVQMPESWDAGAIYWQYLWSSTITSGGVSMWLRAKALGNSDAIGGIAWGTADEIVDTASTANDLWVSSKTSPMTVGNTPAAGDWVVFELYRDVSDASDTMAGDLRLHGLSLFYTTNAATDD